MLGPLEISLAAAALLVGATGTFSPCGLSVVETIGPRGHAGGRIVTAAAIATFVPGAIAGGLITFGSLAVAGDLMLGPSRAAYLLAAAVAALAALLEARGTRIVPQIRRQLPERWRRVMPMPLAAALYGVLLGLGFTTFVLSFGVWALAGISLALGDPGLGLLLGLCFGLGRALPVAVLAPLDGQAAGIKAKEMMCEHPGVYLGLRRGDAATLLVSAVALVAVPGSAGAEDEAALSATDPGATADALVYERLSQEGVIQSGGREQSLPGTDPAIGGPYVAVRNGDAVKLLDRASLAPVAEIPAVGADALAVSANWLVYRVAPSGGGDVLLARSIANPAAPGAPFTVDSIAGPAQISGPALDGDDLVYAQSGPQSSRVVRVALGTGLRHTLVASGRLQLFSPSVRGDSFGYVRADARRGVFLQREFKGKGAGQVLYSLRRPHGQLWSTALSKDTAYVTVLDPDATSPSARIVRVDRKGRSPRRLDAAPRGGGNHTF
ncbi:MAG: hypothetical protein ABR536_04430 [Solirubrobacterales bacterium]